MRRRRRVPVQGYDAATDRWLTLDAAGAARRQDLLVTTYNVWFDDLHAHDRYQAIADLLEPDMPDVMVFQEVTPSGLAAFLGQPWVREHYRSASVVGADVGNYGMLMLTRLPVTGVTYVPLPTELSRGILVAEFRINGLPLTVCSVHLDSGKQRSRLRARQLRRVAHTLRSVEDAVFLGDFNMRDDENGRIATPYRDVWPMLRPRDPGFTEDTTINLMRYDMKDKHRHVRFDRVLLKGHAWSATSIDLLGTEALSPDLPRVFPSDHFGVRCRFVEHPNAETRARPRWYGRRLRRPPR